MVEYLEQAALTGGTAQLEAKSADASAPDVPPQPADTEGIMKDLTGGHPEPDQAAQHAKHDQAGQEAKPPDQAAAEGKSQPIQGDAQGTQQG